ncbi:MAG: glycerate kinase, partial [Chloroflexota bacterium]
MAGVRGGPLRVLVAPDSFKGSLTSVEVARALADGWSRARPDDEVALAPLADGGEGTLDAVAAAGGWRSLPAAARDPLMRPIDGRFLRQGPRAIVELATASGLSRVTRAERDAAAATTLGTGQILAAAIGLGCTDIVLGLGGSATTDGGTGLLTALGVRFLDASGRDLEPGGGALDHLATVDLSGVPELLSEVTLTVAS